MMRFLTCVGFALLVSAATVQADDCYEQCENCAADPAFIQRDSRRADIVKVLRETRKETYHKEVVGGFLVVAEKVADSPVDSQDEEADSSLWQITNLVEDAKGE